MAISEGDGWLEKGANVSRESHLASAIGQVFSSLLGKGARTGKPQLRAKCLAAAG